MSDSHSPSPESSTGYREIVLPLPGRPKDAPIIYEAFNHPLLPLNGKRAYVFFMETSLTAMKKNLEYEKGLEIPHGKTSAQLEKQGDYLFAACTRINQDARRPSEDFIKLWVTKNTDPSTRVKIANARNDALGDRNSRTDKKSKWNRRHGYSGGVEIERSHRARGKNRAQTLGTSRQNLPKIVAPARASKVGDVDRVWDENLSIRYRLLDWSFQSGSEAASASINAGPSDLVEKLKQRTSITNTLRCGSTSVPGCSTVQLNIAAAQNHDEAGDMKSIGRAGGVHIDPLDHPGCFTNTFSSPDIPADYCPGQMFLLIARVFADLEEFHALNFSGLHFHGGTAPLPPTGKRRENWETRMVMVNYPQRLALNGEAVFPLASGAGKSGAINITPEMRFPECVIPYVSRIEQVLIRRFRLYPVGEPKDPMATYAREGASISSQEHHVDFVAREMLLMTNFVISQLPRRYRVQLDSDRFLSAISSEVQDGRKTLGPWIDAPGFRKKDASRSLHQSGEYIEDLVDQTPIRQQIIRELNDHQDRLARSVPQCVVSKKVDPLSEHDIVNMLPDIDEKSLPVKDITLSYGERERLDPYASKRLRVLKERPGGTDAVNEEDDKGEEDMVADELFDELLYPGARAPRRTRKRSSESDDTNSGEPPKKKNKKTKKNVKKPQNLPKATYIKGQASEKPAN
ncbi:hypothetical protein BJ912DRAFT_930238 [Pholiota molesta]|nr:hypothetical protein BJ912DRAFT_930238 [Pholiota molesta]